MKKHNGGVSLLEIVLVIGIITILAGLIMPAISIMRNNSHKAEASAEITQLDTALIAFFTDNGYYPRPGLQQMVASLKDKYFDFNNSRLDGDIYKDPLGNSYLYICPGVIHPKSYDLYSSGLLIAQGEIGTLQKVLSAVSLSSSSSDSEEESEIGVLPIDVVIGKPASIDEKTIWGLTEPTYDILIKAALSLLRSTDIGFILDWKINIANIPIRWMTAAEQESSTAIAWYNTTNHEIVIDPDYSYPSNVVATILAHEATHLSDHLANSDQYFDSLQEEYDAFYNMAMVWKELKGEQTDSLMDYIQTFIEAGEEISKEIIRPSYYYLPENEEYGDAYVVAKKY